MHSASCGGSSCLAVSMLHTMVSVGMCLGAIVYLNPLERILSVGSLSGSLEMFFTDDPTYDFSTLNFWQWPFWKTLYESRCHFATCWTPHVIENIPYELFPNCNDSTRYYLFEIHPTDQKQPAPLAGPQTSERFCSTQSPQTHPQFLSRIDHNHWPPRFLGPRPTRSPPSSLQRRSRCGGSRPPPRKETAKNRYHLRSPWRRARSRLFPTQRREASSASRGLRGGGRPRMFLLLLLLGGVWCDVRSSVGSSEKNPKVFNIGGVLSNDDSINHFKETIEVRGGRGRWEGLIVWFCSMWTSTSSTFRRGSLIITLRSLWIRTL